MVQYQKNDSSPKEAEKNGRLVLQKLAKACKDEALL